MMDDFPNARISSPEEKSQIYVLAVNDGLEPYASNY